MNSAGPVRLPGMTEPKTYTLDVPGAVLSYDIRADETSTEPGHDGFLGGEYGSTGEPDAFAATLRAVLAG